MRVTKWVARARSVLALVADRVLRGLLALGVMTTGIMAPGWLRERGERWWEGAAPAAKDPEPRPPAVVAPTEPSALGDPGLLRELRSLRGSQDLPALDETTAAYGDPAPHWHPERRPANGD